MPTYDYKCEKCDHLFEMVQKMSDDPLKKCPECKGKVKRLIGAGAGLIFKGSGFYTTDYRSESYKKGAESEKSNSADSSSGDSKSSGDGKGSNDSKSSGNKGSTDKKANKAKAD